ncbi:MAG: helix-turn-helix domain-containing protein [Nanoarchaeota archaeon]|nr:helix-turn-helix domain-containing protein [Nanoarchaeota archaeon]
MAQDNNSIKWNNWNSLAKNKKLTETLELTYTLFKSGKTFEEILNLRNFKQDTLERQFIELIAKGIIDARDIIDETKFEKIKNIIEIDKPKSLSEIKNKLPSNFTWFEIKCTLAYFNSFPKRK